MTYVGWHEKPERTTPTAIVSRPPDDLKALRKQLAGQLPDVEYTPEEHTIHACVVGARKYDH
jgi:hypothetical protein